MPSKTQTRHLRRKRRSGLPQLRRLRRNARCDAWQGFLFSGARPADEIDLMMGGEMRYANS